jgi:hypothetical protein
VHPAPKWLVTWKRPVLGTYSARLERPCELDSAPQALEKHTSLGNQQSADSMLDSFRFAVTREG